MELLLLESTIVSILEVCGIFSALIIPFFFLLLIARFRGFFASIFFLPFIHGLLYFLTTIEVVNTTLIGLGDFGNGLLAGIAVISEFLISTIYQGLSYPVVYVAKVFTFVVKSWLIN